MNEKQKIMKKTIWLTLCLAFSIHLMAENLDSLYAQDLLKPGTEVPDFTLKNYKGEDRTLSKARGGYVVLDFWASWCPDCRKDIPILTALYQAYKSQGVRFIGVSFDTDGGIWQQCVRENKMFWTQLCDYKKPRDSQVAKDFGVKWIPSMYLIDPEGKVVLATVDIQKLAEKLSTLRKSGDLKLKMDKYPTYPGGSEALRKYLFHSVRYPKKAQRLGAEGRVVVSFVVNTDGSLTNIEAAEITLKDIGGKEYLKLNEAEREIAKNQVKDLFRWEAIRVAKGMKKWEPGEKNGKKVKVRYNVPITFSLIRSSEY